VELTDAVRRRRMTRNFAERPLAPGILDSLVADALRAPSAGNTHGVHLVVLEGPAETARYWDATTDAGWRARSRRYAGMARAPAVVLAYGDPEAYAARYREPDKRPADGSEVGWIVPYWHVDAAFAVMVLLLRAAEAGLGAAFLGNFRGGGDLAAALGVPDRLEWTGAVLLGIPAAPDPPSPSLARGRPSPDRVVHRGRW
jgi:nitroreductase